MSVDKQVNLTIQAGLRGGATFDELTRSIEALEASIDSQNEATKRGEKNYDELRSTLQTLKTLQASLIDQQKSLGKYETAISGIDKTSERVSELSKKLEEVNNKIAQSDKPTKTLLNSQTRLGGQYQAAKIKLEAYQQQADELAKSLSDVGLNTDDLIGSQRKVASSIGDSQKSVERLNQSIASYGDTIRDANKESARLAEQEKARLAEEVRARTEHSEKLKGLNNKLSYARQKVAQEEAQRLAEEKQRLKDHQRTLSELNNKIGVSRKLRAEQEKRAAQEERAANEKAAQAAKERANEEQRLADQRSESMRQMSRAFGDFDNTGRKSLSLLQRIRGEVLSVTASFVGLYGAITQASEALQDYRNVQAVQNRMAVLVGNDQEKIAEQMEYIASVANGLGIDIRVAGDSYSRFAIAATKAGASLQEAQYIFEGLTSVGRVLGLTSDEMGRAFKAVEQMFSKGKVSAEELRGQLSEALPGAVGEFSASWDKFRENAEKEFDIPLDKALEKGLVSAKHVLNFIEQYRASVEDRLGDAFKTLAAEEGRAMTALRQFRLEVANNGVLAEYTNLLRDITEAMSSDAGKEFAKDLAEVLSAMVKFGRWVVQNWEPIVKLLTVGGFAILISLMGRAATVLVGLIKVFVTFTSKLRMSSKMLGANATSAQLARLGFSALWGVLTRFIPVLGVITIALEVLHDQFVEVRVVTNDLAASFAKTGVFIEAFYEIIKTSALNLNSIVVNEIVGFVKTTTNAVAGLLDTVGKNELAQKIRDFGSGVKYRELEVHKTFGEIKDGIKSDIETINKFAEAEFLRISKESLRGEKLKKEFEFVGKPSESGVAEIELPGGEDAAKRIATLRAQIEQELNNIQARIEKSDKESLVKRLSAVDRSFRGIREKIKQLGDEGAEYEVRLSKLVVDAKLEETRRFNDTLIKNAEALQNNINDIEAKGARKRSITIADTLESVSKQYEKTYKRIEDVSGTIGRNIAEIRTKLESDVSQEERSRLETQLEVLDVQKQINDETKRRLDVGVTSLQQVSLAKYYEEQINATLSERNAQMTLNNALAESNQISTHDAMIRNQEVIDTTNEAMRESVDHAIAFGEAMIDAADGNQEVIKYWSQWIQQIRTAQAEMEKQKSIIITVTQVNDILTSNAATGMDSFAKSTADLLLGFKSLGDVWRDLGDIFRKFASQVLLDISRIATQKALLGLFSSTGIGGFFANLFHTGGVVGGGSQTRMVNPMIFANAPRYHGGGIAGYAPNLASDEVPAILKENEEVLRADDPRHRNNGGGQSGTSLKIINAIDSQSVVTEGLSTTSGEKSVMNIIRANASSVKQIIG